MTGFLDQLGDQFEVVAGSERRRIRRRRFGARSVAVVTVLAAAAVGWSALGSEPVELRATTDPAAGSLEGVTDGVDPPSTPLSIAPEHVPGPAANPTETSVPAGDTAPTSSGPAIAAGAATNGDGANGHDDKPTAEGGAAGGSCGGPIYATSAQLDGSGSGPVSWVDGVSISAFGPDDGPAQLWLAEDRIGVEGGRYDYQLDFMPGAGASERLRLQFAEPICDLEIGVTLLERAEFEDLNEVLHWSAIAGDGSVLATATLDPSDGELADPNVTWFNLDVPAGTTTVDLRAAPYRPDLAAKSGANSSDYALVAIRAG